MIAKGVSTVIAGLAVFFGLALWQPSQITPPANSNVELAAAADTNAAEGTDTTCGAASASADYRTGEPSTYCADATPAVSTSCNPTPTTNQGANPVAGLSSGSESAAVVLATSCKTPMRANLCGKTCSYKSGDISVTGICAAQNVCKGVSYTNQNGQTCNIGSSGVATCGSVAGGTASNGSATPAAVSPDNSGTTPPPSSQVSNIPSPTAPNTTPSAPPSSSVSNAPSPTAPNTDTSVPPSSSVSNTPSPTAPNTTPSAPPSSQVSNIPSPTAPTYNGTPALNSVATKPATGSQNPFTPVSNYPSGYTGTNAYTPTKPTFGSNFPSQQPVSTASNGSSPLTNFVSSIGNFAASPTGLGSVFDFFTGLLSAPPSTSPPAPTPVPAPQQTQVIVQASPVLQAPVQASTALSFDNPVNPTLSQTSPQTQEQNYQSLLDLLTGSVPAATPSNIASALQQGNNPVEPLVTVDTSNSAQTQDQVPEAASLNSSINLQTPEITSLALNTTNGLENSQTVPEQFYVDEASLAQAQSNYQWLQAQIAAWQNAQDAGVCDNACQNALALLQSESPAEFQQVQQLQAIVSAGPTPLEAAPPTSVSANAAQVVTGQAPEAQQSNITESETSVLQTPVPAEGAPFYTEQNDEWCDQYDQCIPQNSFESSPAPLNPSATAGLAVTNTIQPQNSASVDPIAAITQTVENWWSDIVSLFTPNAPSTAAQAPSCSLFKSLFGGCSGY